MGANIGVHTVRFAGFCSIWKGYLFRAGAIDILHFLLQNVKHLVNVIPLNAALSDSAGLKSFFVAADSAFSGLVTWVLYVDITPGICCLLQRRRHPTGTVQQKSAHRSYQD